MRLAANGLRPEGGTGAWFLELGASDGWHVNSMPAESRGLDTTLTTSKILAMRTSRKPPTLSPKESLILTLLTAGRPLYGLELVAASKGHLKRGTVYVTLGRMEDKGYVESELEDRRPGAAGLPRRLYRPTALGRRVLDAWTLLRSTLAWGTR